MAVVKPFCCIRPDERVAAEVAALPYDVYNRTEACQAVAGRPLSFLNIDRAETQFSEDVDSYDKRVYEKARELLDARIADGTFVTDAERCYYIYRLTMDGRSQTGIVACSSVDDYLSGVIRKHENTREEKEQDRICHVDIINTQTGPIFLAYRGNQQISGIVEAAVAQPPLYDFTAEDGVGHTVWKVRDTDVTLEIEAAFASIPTTYIADGHHRAASAVKVALKRREQHPGYTGKEPYHFFLSVLFPDDQLLIMPYNRVVKDLNGLHKDEVLRKAGEGFLVTCVGKSAFSPGEKGVFAMYLDSNWYELRAKPELLSEDPVNGLDVSILQDHFLAPILGIGDARTDKRIDFIGGIRGLGELERRVSEDMRVAFAMYPTSIEELFQVADAGLLMPPKSTWFEPKLRSGLFLHRLG